ncbi:MAG: NAD-dependent epimerase/dehydratase family protein [Candidatus Woesearchaeota archaeon]
MKTIVTGGAGFIGSHIVDRLIELGHEVIVYDNLSTGKKENINKKARFVNGDIRDLSVLGEAAKGADYVFHLAAQVSVPRSVENPKETFEINLDGTKNIIKAFKEVQKIIFSSSCAVYGDNPKLPMTEDSELKPLSPYAESKVMAEKALNESKKPFVAFRYFNVYGPRQNPETGYAAAIPIFVNKAIKNEEITIFGDGEQTRDFVNVRDIAKANLLVLKKGSGIYNIASNKKMTINELAALILKHAQSKSAIKHEKERAGDILHSLGDYSKARKELGWIPEKEIAEGLTEYIKWLKK